MSVINTNITSMIGQNNLNKSQNALTTSMERLSSGLRINSAKDDAAGQAIANRFSAQITGLGQAQRNANDGISIAQTAEGGLNQVNDNLQRVRELTVQASNGTNSQSDLESIQNEINQRMAEIDRISKETDFNGTKVLAADNNLSIQVGADDGQTISVGLQQITSQTLGLDGFNVDGSGEVANRAANQSDLTSQTNAVQNGNNYTVTEEFEAVSLEKLVGQLSNGDTVTVGTGTAATEYTFDADTGNFTFADTATSAATAGSLASEHIPSAGNTNTGTYEFANGQVGNFEVDANGNLTMEGQAAYITADGALTATPGSTGASQATLQDLFETVGGSAGTTGNMAINIDGQTYTGSDVGATFTADISATNYTTAATTTTATTFATDSGMTLADGATSATAIAGATNAATLASTLQAGITEITSATVDTDGNLVVEYADGVDADAANAALSTLIGGGAVSTTTTEEGVSYQNTASVDEVLSRAGGNATTVDMQVGITDATVEFSDAGVMSTAAGNTAVYVDFEGELTTTDEVVTEYNVDPNTAEVTVVSSDGEGKYAQEAGAAVFVDSEGRLSTNETSAGERSEDPLATLDAALAQVDSLRSDLGAIQNRFESAITNLSTNETNLSAARSRIEDADYATEVANMTRAQILQQAGTSVLAQANQIPQNVLSLLG